MATSGFFAEIAMNKVAFAAVCLLTFLVPWDQTVSFGDLGSLARLAGAGTFGLSLLSVVATAKLRRPHAFHILAAAFVLWSAATLLWAFNFGATFQRTSTY